MNVSSEGPWLDVGSGECQICLVVRRLYQPVDRLDVHVCAPCSQVAVVASIPHDYGEGAAEEADDFEAVEVHGVACLCMECVVMRAALVTA